MKNLVLAVSLLLATTCFSQTVIYGQGGHLVTNSAGIVGGTIPVTYYNNDTQVMNGSFNLTLPPISTGTLQHGACLLSGGGLFIDISNPLTYKFFGTTDSSFFCPEGGIWQLFRQHGENFYALSFGVTSLTGEGTCSLETVPQIGLWNGSAEVDFIECTIE